MKVTEIYRSKAHKEYCMNMISSREAEQANQRTMKQIYSNFERELQEAMKDARRK